MIFFPLLPSLPLCPDLTLAMQKLYQTFVALAAQLQSVHENVKVGSLPAASINSLLSLKLASTNCILMI